MVNLIPDWYRRQEEEQSQASLTDEELSKRWNAPKVWDISKTLDAISKKIEPKVSVKPIDKTSLPEASVKPTIDTSLSKVSVKPTDTSFDLPKLSVSEYKPSFSSQYNQLSKTLDAISNISSKKETISAKTVTDYRPTFQSLFEQKSYRPPAEPSLKVKPFVTPPSNIIDELRVIMPQLKENIRVIPEDERTLRYQEKTLQSMLDNLEKEHQRILSKGELITLDDVSIFEKQQNEAKKFYEKYRQEIESYNKVHRYAPDYLSSLKDQSFAIPKELMPKTVGDIAQDWNQFIKDKESGILDLQDPKGYQVKVPELILRTIAGELLPNIGRTGLGLTKAGAELKTEFYKNIPVINKIVNKENDKILKVVDGMLDKLTKYQQETLSPIYEKPKWSEFTKTKQDKFKQKFNELLSQNISATISLAEMVGISIATGGTGLGLGVMGAMTGTEMYLKARYKDVSPIASASLGVAMGLTTAITEKIPLNYIFGTASKGLKNYLMFYVLETAQEITEQVGDNLLTMTFDKDVKITDQLKETMTAMILPTLFGGTMSNVQRSQTIKNIISESEKQGVRINKQQAGKILKDSETTFENRTTEAFINIQERIKQAIKEVDIHKARPGFIKLPGKTPVEGEIELEELEVEPIIPTQKPQEAVREVLEPEVVKEPTELEIQPETKEFQIGITSVKGFDEAQFQKDNELVDRGLELENQGNFDLAQDTFNKALVSGQKILGENLKTISDDVNIKKSIGRLFKTTEPTLYTNVTVSNKNVDKFIDTVSTISGDLFKQSSVIVSNALPIDKTYQYGILDSKKGTSIEPTIDIILNRKITLADNKLLDELFAKYDLIKGATIKPDGSGIEITNLSKFNQNYEQFKKDTWDLAEDFKQQGILRSVQERSRKTWSIGISNKDALTTYKQIHSDFQTIGTEKSKEKEEVKPTEKVIQAIKTRPDVVSAEKISKAIRDVEKISRPAKYSEIKKAIKETTGKKISDFIKMREYTLLKTKLRNIIRGIREGRKTKSEEIINAQKQLRKFVKDSKLEPKFRDKFDSIIRNVAKAKNPITKMVSILSDIRSKISDIKTKLSKKDLITSIRKNLKAFKIKKGKVGKLTVEYEMLRDAMLNIYFDKNKLRTKNDNIVLLEDIQKRLEDKSTGSQIVPRDFVLQALLTENDRSINGLGEMTTGELETLLIRIQQTKKIARDSFLWKQIERTAKLEKDIDTAVENMSAKTDKNIFSNKIKIKEFLKRAYDIADIRDRGYAQIVSFLDSIKGGKFFLNTLYQPISEANKKMFIKEHDRREEDRIFLESIFNKKDIFLDNKLRKMNKQKYIGKFKDVNGNKIDLFFTDFEMIDIYNSLKMKDNREAMIKDGIYIGKKFGEGRVIKINDNIIKAVKNNMSPESKKMADYIISKIENKEFFKGMTNAYENKYNKPFPAVDGYWGMPRKHVGKKRITDRLDMFHQEQEKRGLPSPASFNQRVKNNNPLLIQNGWTKYTNGWNGITRFVEYNEAFEDIKAIITNNDFKNKFIEILGRNNYKQLEESFDWTASGGIRTVNVGAIGKVVNSLQTMLTINYIGSKIRNVLSQGTSGVAAMAEVPIKEFIKGIGNMMVNPGKAYYKMMESPIIRYRHEKADFSKGMFLQETEKIQKYTEFKPARMSMIFTRIGDMTGVIIAGYNIYQYNYKQYIKQGMNEELADKYALQDAENFAIFTQQSALAEFANAIKRAHPVVRSLGRFQQAQSMYRAKGANAIRTWMNKGDEKWEKKNFLPMAKKVITYHFTLPALYELSKGNFNPISIASRTILSPISGFMGWGKFVEYGIMLGFIRMMMITGDDDDDEKLKDLLPFKPDWIGNETWKIVERTVKSFGDLVESDYAYPEDKGEDILNIIDGTLVPLKIPTKNIREEVMKLDDMLSGDIPLRLLETEWQSEKRKEKEPKSSVKGFDWDAMDDEIKGFDWDAMDDEIKGFDWDAMDDEIKGFDWEDQE